MGEGLIHDILEKQTYWRAEKLAVAFEGAEYTYQEFDRRVNRVANALLDNGIESGDRILVHGHNHADWYTLFFACSKLGVTYCPVSKFQSLNNLAYIVEELDPAYICYTGDDDIVNKRLPTIRENAGTATYLSVDPGTDDPSLETFAAGAKDAEPDVTRPSPERLHNILWTSGTTGAPKAVARDHRSSLHFGDNLTNELPFDGNDVRVITNPMMLLDPYFHYGLPTFAVGGTIAIPRRFDADKLYSLIDSYEANALHLGFTLARVMVEYLDEQELDLNLDYLTGVVPSANVARSLLPLTDELYQVYGTSEIGLPLVKRLRPPFEGKPALGKPGISADVRVVPLDADDDFPIPEEPPQPGDTGLLICRGEVTMTRYLRDELQREHVHNGWISPGDVVTINEQRDVVFVGREDDRLRSGGVNVYPSVVENALEDHPAVENAVVVGVDDEKWGDRICALIVSSDAVGLSERLDEHCREHPDLSAELRPKEYAFVASSNEIPTGAQEKEDREKIKQRFFHA